MDLKVSLRPHIGKIQTAVGTFDQDMGQCFVMVNDKTVGIYCGRENEPNKYLSFTEFLPAAAQEAIAAKVADLTGGVSKYNSPPPEEHEVISHDDE